MRMYFPKCQMKKVFQEGVSDKLDQKLLSPVKLKCENYPFRFSQMQVLVTLTGTASLYS